MSVEFQFRRGHALYVGIYKITSPSGKVYIGQSWDIIERWRCYKSSYPLRGQPKLANSLRKYGAVNHIFEIIAWFSAGCDQPTLDTRERAAIEEQRSAGIELLNIREGGRGGRPAPESSAKMVATRRARGSYIVSDELKRRRSEQSKGRPGTPHTAETKLRLSELARGRVQSLEARERNRRSQLGRKHPDEVKAKIGNANRGNKRPDLAEYNRKFKTGKPGRKLSDETKRKIGEAHRGTSKAKGRVQSPEERRMRSEITARWWAERKAGHVR